MPGPPASETGSANKFSDGGEEGRATGPEHRCPRPSALVLFVHPFTMTSPFLSDEGVGDGAQAQAALAC
jgi:hypothetical protein